MNKTKEFSHQFCSQHSLITSFVEFNQSRDKFLTCGEEGQINVYELKDAGKVNKLSYTNLFGEAVVCVKWGNFVAGGAVAVAGSLGKLLILRITNQCVLKQKQFTFKDNIVYSLDWNRQKPQLFVGMANGQYIFIEFSQQQWRISNSGSISKNPVIVACGSSFTNEYFVAADSTLYQILKTNKEDKKSINVYSKVLSILVSNQLIDKETYMTEILVLCKDQFKGKNQIKVYLMERTLNRKQTQRIKQPFQQFQSIELQESGYGWMSWGSTQSQVALYSLQIQSGAKEQAETNSIRSPLVFTKKLNGKYRRK